MPADSFTTVSKLGVRLNARHDCGLSIEANRI
jgi:hypothetical protein